MFAALDGGVYFSENNGENWDYVGVGMPFATVSELAMDYANEKLIAGTYSRSMWSYDASWVFEEVEDPIDDTGIEELGNLNRIHVYPNPVVDQVYFESVDANNFHVFDSGGKLVLSANVTHSANFSQANLDQLKSGIYFFKVGESVGKLIKK